MMNILAIVPARGGSKRIPRKNVRLLGGRPLLTWTVDSAVASNCFDRVIVSTDDGPTASLAVACGAEVPRMRPASLATDEALAVDVVLDVIDNIERCGEPVPDAVMLLQPTSPFRTPGSIRRAVQVMGSGFDSVVSVSPARGHPYWCQTLDSDGCLTPLFPDGVTLRAQDLPPVYELNGCLYLTRLATIRTARRVYGDRSFGLIMDDPAESLDIDTEFDWMIAEAIAAERTGGR